MKILPRKRGPKGKLTAVQRAEALRRYLHEPDTTVNAIADEYGVSSQTIYNLINEHKGDESKGDSGEAAS